MVPAANSARSSSLSVSTAMASAVLPEGVRSISGRIDSPCGVRVGIRKRRAVVPSGAAEAFKAPKMRGPAAVFGGVGDNCLSTDVAG